jgi:hypothetical protein
MSLIGWLKGNRLVDVTAQDPLPVQQQGAITTRTADTLLVATTTVTTTTNRDLMENTNTERPRSITADSTVNSSGSTSAQAAPLPPTASSHARPTCPHNRSAQAGKNSPQARSQATQTAGTASKSQAQATATTTSTALKSTAPTAATTHSQVNLSECADDPHHWRLAT